MATNSSGKVFGTSSDTTSSVTAKAKTASVKPSSRVTSGPRQLKPGSPLVWLEVRWLRNMDGGLSMEQDLACPQHSVASGGIRPRLYADGRSRFATRSTAHGPNSD